MTQPRRIVAGQFYMITRRTTQRQFLLRPDDVVTGTFEYCLAEAAERHDIQLIAWVAMSNHYHAIVYDREGQLPAFLEHFHRTPSRCLNEYHERSENFWAATQTCVTHLVTLDDVFDKVIYVLTNPATADLVESVAHWPGSSSWERMGRPAKQAMRPLLYFRKDGIMPMSAPLSAVTPTGLRGETGAQWVARVRKTVLLRQEELRRKRLAKKVKLVGRKAVQDTSPFAFPSTPSASGNLRPALACKDPKLMVEARRILRGFRVAYQSAFMKLREQTATWFSKGKETAAARALLRKRGHEIEFPPGTYRVRVLFSVPIGREVAAA